MEMRTQVIRSVSVLTLDERIRSSFFVTFVIAEIINGRFASVQCSKYSSSTVSSIVILIHIDTVLISHIIMITASG